MDNNIWNQNDTLLVLNSQGKTTWGFYINLYISMQLGSFGDAFFWDISFFYTAVLHLK